MNVSGTTYSEGQKNGKPLASVLATTTLSPSSIVCLLLLLLYGIRFSKLSFKVVGALALRWKNIGCAFTRARSVLRATGVIKHLEHQ